MTNALFMQKLILLIKLFFANEIMKYHMKFYSHVYVILAMSCPALGMLFFKFCSRKRKTDPKLGFLDSKDKCVL